MNAVSSSETQTTIPAGAPSAGVAAGRSVSPEPGRDLPPAGRRRGAALLDAIYAAVIAELAEGGIGPLSMERVAERAHTGKAALYRRWANSDALLIDAITHALPEPGSVMAGQDVRQHLLALLSEMVTTLSSPVGGVMRHVIAAAASNDGLRRALLEDVIRPRQRAVLAAIASGVADGTVRTGAATELVAEVGPSLLVHRFLTQGAVSYADAVAIVDQILTPLLAPSGEARALR